MSQPSLLKTVEQAIVEKLVAALDDPHDSHTVADYSRLADDYDTLCLMGELPAFAGPAQAAVADMPGLEALHAEQMAGMLGRAYRRAIQLAGQ